MVTNPSNQEALKQGRLALEVVRGLARDLQGTELRQKLGGGWINDYLDNAARKDAETWWQGRELEGRLPINTDQESLVGTHYDWYFPRIVDRLWWKDAWDDEDAAWPVLIVDVSRDDEQTLSQCAGGGCRYDRLVPLSQLLEKGRHVDLRTSAWMVGQLLEMLTFYEQYFYDDITDYLVDPVEHWLVRLDCGKAGGSSYFLTKNVRSIAVIGLQLIGAEREIVNGQAQWRYALAETEAEKKYLEILKDMAEHPSEYLYGTMRIWDVHSLYYGAVKDLWPLEFHKFTVI